MKELTRGEKINVVVPTGNFGNILAAYYARQMGLPIEKLICASNENKVLYEFLDTGIYDKLRKFVTTISPSMDILISSNLERLLYSIGNEDTNKVRELMNNLDSDGTYEISEEMRKRLSDFYGNFASETKTREAIKEVFDKYKYIMDTHTAVAYCVDKKYKNDSKDERKTLMVSTASPYKFTHSVMSSIDNKYDEFNDFSLIKEMGKLVGENPPVTITDLQNADVIHTIVCKKDEMKDVIKQILNI